MSRLSVTFIDVGWGDSILIEAEDASGHARYGLVDCNDTTYERSAYLFVKRYMERVLENSTIPFPLFDFILLTHAHTDHLSGLQFMMRDFGTDWFWYPKSDGAAFTKLLRYANRYTQKVARHQSVDNSKTMPDLGDVKLEVLWPPNTTGPYDADNANNNSVVLRLKLGDVSFVLTGDCQAENWPNIVGSLPSSGLRMFQSPHHGAQNGMFDDTATPWLDQLGTRTRIGMSSHVVPHDHPHEDVVDELDRRDFTNVYRTDQHYHVTFATDGSRPSAIEVQWSRF